jgi:hypothetical protein
MALPARDKIAAVDWALGELTKRFDVVGTAEHARQIVDAGVRRSRPSAGAGPKGRSASSTTA